MSDSSEWDDDLSFTIHCTYDPTIDVLCEICGEKQADHVLTVVDRGTPPRISIVCEDCI